jgi:hypothetical protein
MPGENCYEMHPNLPSCTDVKSAPLTGALSETILVILKIDPTNALMDKFYHTTPEYNRLLHDQQERLKELACINQTTAILKEGKPIEESLQQIVLLLPAAWQYPGIYSVSYQVHGKRV